MPEPLAIWNRNRDVWEDMEGATCLFCGQQDVFSETFPSAGMTRSGALFPLPQWEPRTVATGSSSSPDDETTEHLFRQPCAAEAGGMLLPTPQANIADNGGSQHPDKRREGGHSVSIQDVAEHLLPTPRASDGTKGGPNQRGSSGDLMLPSAVQPERFGPFTPVIRRWETVLGREAPAPTESTGRGGKHRLSAKFCEWMMGLPDGWVTDPEIGLTRNEQLKALGNGVVPQQAAAALSDMLTSFTTKT